MKCQACGKKIPAKSKFCSYCGQPQAQGGSDLDQLKELMGQGRYDTALAKLEALGPEVRLPADLLGMWAHALYASGRFEDASKKYGEALALNPDLADANLYRGLALKEMGNMAEAARHLEEAARLDEANPLAFGILGDLYMGQGDFQKSIQAYGNALKRVSDPASQLALHNDLGVACFRAGQLAEAMEEFKWVIKRDPKNQNAIYNLGVLYLKQGLPEDLHQEWKEFLKSDDAAGILVGLTRSMVEAAKTETGAQDPVGLVGSSLAMRAVLDLVKRASQSTANVLIQGENGTGKELVARAIHLASPRSQKPFVAIHCGALPETLLESELFGYEKGAFTGAYAAKPGRFELAEGGTLFLDEIGDLNPTVQVKLLRVIQERTFERLGGTKTLRADVRLVAATHRDLRQRVAIGAFREDLFYRLYVIPLQIPPLRERGNDVRELAQYFLERFSRRAGKRFTGFHPETLALLESHAWPGNVRELENVVERTVALYDDSLVLPAYLQFDRTQGPIHPSAPPPLAPSSTNDGTSQTNGLSQSVADAEKNRIVDALERSYYRLPKAAQTLGISRVTLWRKMQKYQIGQKQK
jgi:transcriptional regulator with PAS, ATPase and Fis domain